MEDNRNTILLNQWNDALTFRKQDAKILIATDKTGMVEVYTTIKEQERLIRALTTTIEILKGGKKIILLNS